MRGWLGFSTTATAGRPASGGRGAGGAGAARSSRGSMLVRLALLAMLLPMPVVGCGGRHFPPAVAAPVPAYMRDLRILLYAEGSASFCFSAVEEAFKDAGIRVVPEHDHW